VPRTTSKDTAILEHRDRIKWRPCATSNREWRRHQKEFPSVAFSRGLCERLEVAVVEEVHPEVQQREVVHSPRQLRRRDILRMVATHQRNISLFEPRND